MRISPFSWIILNSFVVAAFLSINVVLVSGQCQSDQRQLLLQLKSRFNSTSLGKLEKWNQTTDCCSWDGVTCDASGQVIGLDLSNQSISGAIDKSSSLFRFEHLQRLNLAYNRFMPAFPTGFDKLENLSYLNLSNAGFTGQIPAAISRMTRLVTLDLSVSSLLGRSLKLGMPNLEMLVRNLTKIKSLHLDGVNITARGNEWCQAVSQLTNLQVLSMSNCYLSGPINSSLSKLRYLLEIRLDNNNLSASVPRFFAEFPNLTSLRLSTTGLNGRLPEEVLQLPTLQILDLSNNPLLEGSFQKFPVNASLQTLALSGTKFGGQVPESIGNLGQLRRIELAKCNFSGPIPESVKKLTQLVYLDFSGNKFSGPMPSFSSSRNLTQLNLAYNQLNGTIHSTKWSGLSKLVSIDLRDNKLSGTIPPTLFGIPSLQKIFLSQNQFNGSLSDLPGKTTLLLDTLDLSSNKLQGQFPKSVFELQGLKILTISSNKFSGFIKWTDIQKLRNLSSLDLSYNNFSVDATSTNSALYSSPNITRLKLASCNLKKFPGVLKNQLKLNHLDLSKNQISGEIPNWVWEIKSLAYLNLSQNFLTKFEGPLQNIMSSLTVIDLHGNQLQGKIPSLPPYATYLDYSKNNFSSVLPSKIGDSLQFAYFFSLSGNNFHGRIPRSICSSSYLKVLDLSNNSLSGPIPQCLTQMSASLGVLNLRRNTLIGNISDTFPENCGLQTLDLSRNTLQGKVPKSLVNCKMLEVLDLGNNQLSDTFPCHLKNITRLRVLVLRANKFNGNIHCSEKKSPWPMLQIVDLSSNGFSGRLHETCLSTWKAMQDAEEEAVSKLKHLSFKVLELNPFYYEDAITVTIKGLELELVKILTVFTSIDISRNNFEGPIPEVIGTFEALYVLNFSHNAFTGSIPPFLGNLSQLESLDLSSNNFHGEIPSQLAKLNFLSVFNVSNNKLVGWIPTSTQIQSFSEASFENNAGLCGPPLNTTCTNRPSEAPHTVQETDEFDWQFIFIGMGFGLGAAVYVAPLIFWKTASKLVDKNVDRILGVILPKVGLTYKRPDDTKVDADENLEEDNTESDDEAVPCIALSKNDSYVMSATGGKVSLFNMMTFKVMTTFMSPPPASTFLAFHPQDNNIIAIGMEDSIINIYNVRVDEVKSKLKGHQKRITGLAFSTSLNILVSSGADAHLCVWSIDTWEKRKSVAIQIPAGKAPTGDTRVQFHTDQVRMLVVHESQLAIYDTSKMECIRQWIPQDILPAPISYATYSCNSQSVYANFFDGNIGVFDADSLRLRCRIAPSVYLSPAILKGNQAVYPLVVAAHPMEANQFAIGLSDGSVKVMEPSESEGKWGVSLPADNGVLNGRTTSPSNTSNHTPDHLQR